MRINKIERTNKEYTDAQTGLKIPAGSQVFSWTPWGGPRMVSLTFPKPSMTASNETLKAVYLASEQIEAAAPDDPDTPAEVTDFIETILDQAEEVRTAAESFGESADNMEQAFTSGSSKIDELRSRQDAAETMAEELDEAADELRAAVDRWQEFIDRNA